jgi:hypothetical protein
MDPRPPYRRPHTPISTEGSLRLRLKSPKNSIRRLTNFRVGQGEGVSKDTHAFRDVERLASFYSDFGRRVCACGFLKFLKFLARKKWYALQRARFATLPFESKETAFQAALNASKVRSVDEVEGNSANGAAVRKLSKRGIAGEGRPTKRTPEVVAKIANAIATGLTDEEAALLSGIDPETMRVWRKDPEFSGAIKMATAKRLLMRMERIEAGEAGWQGTAWALERLYPTRFARPEIQQQIAVVNGNNAERIMVIDSSSFDSLIGRPGYRLRNNGELEFKEGGTAYLIVRQTSNANLLQD